MEKTKKQKFAFVKKHMHRDYKGKNTIMICVNGGSTLVTAENIPNDRLNEMYNSTVKRFGNV